MGASCSPAESEVRVNHYTGTTMAFGATELLKKKLNNPRNFITCIFSLRPVFDNQFFHPRAVQITCTTAQLAKINIELEMSSPPLMLLKLTFLII